MNRSDIVQLVNGALLCGQPMAYHRAVYFASDRMSEVLTKDHHSMILVTGLCNIQTIRTAEMAEIGHIVFTNNCKPDSNMLALAKNEGITLISTMKTTFEVCKILHTEGFKPAS